MVSFQHILTAIRSNPHSALHVATHRLKPQLSVESFKLPTVRIEPAVIPSLRRMTAAKSSSAVGTVAPPSTRLPSPTRSEGSTEPLPLPTRALAVPKVSLQNPAPPTNPAPPAPPSPSPSPPRFTRSEERQERQERQERPGRPQDPLCIALETRDAMYAIANGSHKQAMEAAEARRLETRLPTLYKSESGRSRGWVKTKLEAFLLPRAAVGSRVAAKDAFDWGKIWSDKEASATLDFLCLAKGIRLAVWCDAEKRVGLWPAADATAADATSGADVVGTATTISLHHVSHLGAPLGERDILERVGSAGFKLVAPLSVEHALEKLTLADLEAVAEKLGAPALGGKKGDRVKALASLRMLLRLQA